MSAEKKREYDLLELGTFRVHPSAVLGVKGGRETSAWVCSSPPPGNTCVVFVVKKVRNDAGLLNT